MKNIYKVTVLVCLTASASNVMAGQNANIQIKGTVVQGACTPTLGNGGIIDLGTISSQAVPEGGMIVDPQVLSLAISCTAPTKVMMGVADNRYESRVDNDQTYGFLGLGMAGDIKIGAYTILLRDAVLDGNTADIVSSENADNMSNPSAGDFRNVGNYNKWYYVANESGGGNKLSFSTIGGSDPLSFTHATANLKIYPLISGKVRSITEVATIDGNATISFEYL